MVVDFTSITLGSILAEIGKENIDKVLNLLQKMSVIVESGVESVGPPSAYSLVWEFGNVRQKHQGPKTVQGRDEKGRFSSAWFSTQAPRGWIGIHEPAIWKIIEEEIGKVSFDSVQDITEDSLKQELEQAYLNIAERALVLLQSTVPIDSGDLYDSLKVVPPGDDTLKGISDLASDVISEIGGLNL